MKKLSWDGQSTGSTECDDHSHGDKAERKPERKRFPRQRIDGKTRRNGNGIEKDFDITTKSGNHLLIEGRFKFVSHLWNNNTAYIKVNNELYWMDHHSWEGDTLACDEDKWSNPIRLIVPYKKEKLRITFGIKLNKNFNFEDLKLTYKLNPITKQHFSN